MLVRSRWTNLVYWSAQGPVFKEALADPRGDVGQFFSWTDTPSGLPLCAGRYSNAKQAFGFSNPCGLDATGRQRCAQGSWGSLEASASSRPNFTACGCYPGFPGKCVPSALANLHHAPYFDYLVDALANSWSKNLGMDGYFIDTSMQVQHKTKKHRHKRQPCAHDRHVHSGIAAIYCRRYPTLHV